MRRLRNTLEEVEEVYDDFRTLGPDDLQLLHNVLKASETLQQLDQALQNHVRNADVRESDVGDLKTSLDVLARQLSTGLETVTTGEIPLQLDTSARSFLPSRGVSSSSATGDSRPGRKSSQASSSWSSAQRDSASYPDTTGSERAEGLQKPSSEKELYDSNKVLLSPSTSLGEFKRPSLDWRSPFASPDPLSISIEEASTLILTPDEELPLSAVRSRSGTGSTVFAQPYASPRTEENVSETTPAVTEESSTTTGDDRRDVSPMPSGSPSPIIDDPPSPRRELTPSPPLTVDESPPLPKIDAASSPTLTVSEPPPPPPPPKDDVAISPTMTVDIPAASDDVATVPLSPPSNAPTSPKAGALSPVATQHFPRRLSESSFLSPASAAMHRTRSNRSQSLSSLKKASEDASIMPVRSTGSSSQQIWVNRSLNGLNLQLVPLSVPENATGPAQDAPKEERSVATSPQQISSQCPERPATPTSTSLQNSPAHSPPPPTRKPPPPPTRRSVRTETRTVRMSSYRVVNASPIDVDSSDDDLYGASPPTSPKKAIVPRSPPTEIPQVKVADHDVEAQSRSPVPGSATSEIDLFKQAERQAAERAAPESVKLVSGSDAGEPKDAMMIPPQEFPSPGLGISIPEEDTEPQPPPLPKRPARYGGSISQQKGPHISTFVTPKPNAMEKQRSQTSVSQKEVAPESGPEVSSNAKPESGLASKKSVRIHLVPSGNSTPKAPLETSKESPAQGDNSAPAVTEWYGPGSDGSSLSELELERIKHIAHFWNISNWDQAEAYLTAYLKTLIEENSVAKSRRVRHLLGVAASLKGEWDRAIPLFLATMRRPIQDISTLDDGDCAAAYWLGDAYALQNKRTEALLSYCIAERSSLFQDEHLPELSTLVGLEQEAVQLGASKNDFKLRWAQQAMNNWPSNNPTTIMDTNVITPTAARMLFDNEPRRHRNSTSASGREEPFKLDGNKLRSSAFFSLSKVIMEKEFYRMKLTTAHFEPDTPWPMMYDPTFSMANVQRGRLFAYECDLVNVFSTKTTAKLTRSAAMGLSQVNCFTSSDIFWLIRMIRECLTLYGMEWSEVANVEGTWFLVRYSFMLDRIATTNYFAISLFKQTLRGGYGVDICSDGICSSRILKTNLTYDKGVHNGESKRIKKLIREYLDDAAKLQRPRFGRKSSSTPVMDPVSPEGVPPAMPPRPSPAGYSGAKYA